MPLAESMKNDIFVDLRITYNIQIILKHKYQGTIHTFIQVGLVYN